MQNEVTEAVGGSATAFTRDQLAKLAYVAFYSPVLCAPQNIKAVVDEIDCCPGCDHVSNGGTCSVSERGDYCPNDLATTLRDISLALYGPSDPSHYVASAFGPDKMPALEAALSAAPVAVKVKCETCQGNGEIVTDWDRYLKPHKGDVGDEAVAECPDCDGVGEVAVIEPQEGWRDPDSGETYTAEQLAALLRGRDKFIVDRGLWMEFVASLPASPARGASNG